MFSSLYSSASYLLVSFLFFFSLKLTLFLPYLPLLPIYRDCTYVQVTQTEYMPFDPIVKRTEGSIKVSTTQHSHVRWDNPPFTTINSIYTRCSILLPENQIYIFLSLKIISIHISLSLGKFNWQNFQDNQRCPTRTPQTGKYVPYACICTCIKVFVLGSLFIFRILSHELYFWFLYVLKHVLVSCQTPHIDFIEMTSTKVVKLMITLCILCCVLCVGDIGNDRSSRYQPSFRWSWTWCTLLRHERN